MLRACLLVLLLSSPLYAAVAAVGTASSQTTGVTAATSMTFSHNSGSTGTNRLIICGISRRALTNFDTVTYGGVGMTFLDEEEANATGTEIWYLVSPATGANNVVATTSVTLRFITGCQTYSGVDQASPFNTLSAASGTSTSAPVTSVATAVGEIIFSVLARRDETDAVTTDAGQTELWQDSANDSSSVRGVGSQEAGAGATANLTYTWSNSHSWSHAAVSLKASADTRKSRDIVLGY